MPLPRAQERWAGRSVPASSDSHEAVWVTSLGHHLPAVTQPAPPKVQPQLDVTAQGTLPRLRWAPASMPLAPGAVSCFSSLCPPGLPLAVPCGSLLPLKFSSTASLYEGSFLDPGRRGCEKLQPLPGSHAWFATSGSQDRRHIMRCPKTFVRLGFGFCWTRVCFNWCLTFPRQAKIWFFLQVRLNKQKNKSDPKWCRYPLKFWRGNFLRAYTHLLSIFTPLAFCYSAG